MKNKEDNEHDKLIRKAKLDFNYQWIYDAAGIIFSITIFFLYSCGSNNEDTTTLNYKKEQDYYQKMLDNSHVVKDKDGCEYIIYSSNSRAFMSHKGTCKNTIHK